MFYITTAIDYTNGSPHIGHAYEKVLADVLARWHRMCGEPTYFLTGVDQHGQKVQQKAEEAGIRDKVKIMIGGAPVSEDYCKKIGADCYTVDAASAADAAVEFCK